jgi:hypothetical protein
MIGCVQVHTFTLFSSFVFVLILFLFRDVALFLCVRNKKKPRHYIYWYFVQINIKRQYNLYVRNSTASI